MLGPVPVPERSRSAAILACWLRPAVSRWRALCSSRFLDARASSSCMRSWYAVEVEFVIAVAATVANTR